jgi:hypothetical protein
MLSKFKPSVMVRIAAIGCLILIISFFQNCGNVSFIPPVQTSSIRQLIFSDPEAIGSLDASDDPALPMVLNTTGLTLNYSGITETWSLFDASGSCGLLADGSTPARFILELTADGLFVRRGTCAQMSGSAFLDAIAIGERLPILSSQLRASTTTPANVVIDGVELVYN